MSYPPPLCDEQLEILIAEIKDFQITHGSLLKLVKSDNEHTVLASPVGATLFPTLFPVTLFEEACQLQKLYNKLYTAVAEDESWLYNVLGELIDIDPLANRIWTIYQEVKREGFLQNLSLGVFRSDYMLHTCRSATSAVQLKQVEFNTIACAGGTHGENISAMHRHLQRTGLYEAHVESPSISRQSILISRDMLPHNNVVRTISSGLASAHHTYGHVRSREATRKCILMIVQPFNFNIADERPIEYALWDRDIPTFRVNWGYDILSHTSLTTHGELLYCPPTWAESSTMEVSVVYFRAGFEAHEYDDMGHMARFQLERSRAIKCPSLLSHLTTFKKVQQALAMPGALDHFLAPNEAAAISRTFAPIYPLDNSEMGLHAQNIVLNATEVKEYILKPSLEGGGHNIYGEQITAFLEQNPRDEWHKYILMKRIQSPFLKNFLMSAQRFYEGAVVSELGVFGVCLWEGTGKGAEIFEEQEPSWSFKTKDANVDEMSVVKGYGCFDSPALVDDETFASSISADL